MTAKIALPLAALCTSVLMLVTAWTNAGFSYL